MLRHYGIDSALATQCRSIGGWETIPLVSSCNTDPDACATGVNYPFDTIPVTDLETNVDFINAGCAICNGVTHGDVWSTTVKCEHSEQRHFNNPNDDTNNNDDNNNANNDANPTSDRVASLLRRSDCSLDIDVPSKRALRKCNNYVFAIETCPSDCGNTELAGACERNLSPQYITDNMYTYANVYCALCNSIIPTIEQLECNIYDFIQRGAGGPSFYEYSLSALFEFDSIIAVEHVVAGASVDHVLAITTVNGLGPGRSQQRVVANVTIDKQQHLT